MGILKVLAGAALLFSYSNSTAQSDSGYFDNSKFELNPCVAGFQSEATTSIAVTEFGGSIDFDIFQRKGKRNYSIGTRIALEYYIYFEPGGPTHGGPFTDYCFYGRHSIRGSFINVNMLAGLAYHTRRRPGMYEPDKMLMRVGIEINFNLIYKILNLTLKGSTSFEERTSFLGIGFSIGYNV